MHVTTGKKIKILRILRDMTQVELAEASDTRQYESTTFENDRFQPGPQVRQAIEQALGCRLDDDITITAAGELVCTAPVSAQEVV